MSAREIIAALEAGSSAPDGETIFEQQADLFHRELLEHGDFPEDYFALLLEVLSRLELFRVVGAEMFLSKAYGSRDAMSDEQKQRALLVLAEQYPEYERLTLYWYVADFLARVYPASVVADAIEKVASRVKLQEQVQGLWLALDILLQDADGSDTAFVARIRHVYDVLPGAEN